MHNGVLITAIGRELLGFRGAIIDISSIHLTDLHPRGEKIFERESEGESERESERESESESERMRMLRRDPRNDAAGPRPSAIRNQQSAINTTTPSCFDFAQHDKVA
jgi:hypothetical protein